MSQPERKTVYAYVDLAVDRPYSQGGVGIPLSDGNMHSTWCSMDEFARLWTDTEVTYLTPVRGTTALEVAEREVLEAVRAEGLPGPPFSNALHDWVRAKYPRTCRAIDLRDRLRAKLKYAVDPHDPTRAVTEAYMRCGAHPTATLAAELCMCGHARAAHSWRYGGMACVASPSCSCACFTGIGVDHASGPERSATISWTTEIGASPPRYDVQKLAAEIGCEASCGVRVDASKSLMPTKEVPMPALSTPANPNPHAECRLYMGLKGEVLDDYGRRLNGVRGLVVRPQEYEFDMTVAAIFGTPPDGPLPRREQPEPLYLESNQPIPSTERERICAEVSAKVGGPVVFLPYGIKRAVPPVEPQEERVRADVAHRADLAAASKRAWRAGLVVGAGIMLVLLGPVFFTLAKNHPEWFSPRADSAQRAPLSTPWSPAALDEHARESEAAREDAEGR